MVRIRIIAKILPSVISPTSEIKEHEYDKKKNNTCACWIMDKSLCISMFPIDVYGK